MKRKFKNALASALIASLFMAAAGYFRKIDLGE